MTFTTSRGFSLSEGLKRALSSMRSYADRNVMLGWCIESAVKKHLAARFPGSSHFSPSKVHKRFDMKSQTGAEGEAVVEAAGAGRAYHDVDIFPVRAKALAIPLSFAARGKSPKDIAGLFKAGNVLALKASTGIQPMFALVKHVHQDRDQTIMPSDEKISSKITERWTTLAAKQLSQQLAAL